MRGECLGSKNTICLNKPSSLPLKRTVYHVSFKNKVIIIGKCHLYNTQEIPTITCYRKSSRTPSSCTNVKSNQGLWIMDEVKHSGPNFLSRVLEKSVNIMDVGQRNWLTWNTNQDYHPFSFFFLMDKIWTPSKVHHCGDIYLCVLPFSFLIPRPHNYMEASFIPSLMIKSTLIHMNLFSKGNKSSSLFKSMVHSVLMLELSFNFLCVAKCCD